MRRQKLIEKRPKKPTGEKSEKSTMEGFVDPRFASAFESSNNGSSSFQSGFQSGSGGSSNQEFSSDFAAFGAGPQNTTSNGASFNQKPTFSAFDDSVTSQSSSNTGTHFSTAQNMGRSHPPSHPIPPSTGSSSVSASSIPSASVQQSFSTAANSGGAFGGAVGGGGVSYRADPSSFVQSGTIMSRTSMRTIIMKKWKEGSFWAWQRPCSLLLFRSQEDYKDWMENPYHNEKERMYLVKLRVDFYQDLITPSCRGFNVTQVKSKTYDSKSQVYQFKVEKIMDYGPNILAAFASRNPSTASELHQVISKMIIIGRNGGTMPPPVPNTTGMVPNLGKESEVKGGMSMSPSALSPQQGGNSGGSSGYGGFGGGAIGTPPREGSSERQHYHNQPTPRESKGAYNFESLSLE